MLTTVLFIRLKMRRVFYTAMIAVSSNPDTQKRGLVAVLYFFGGSNNGSSTTNADQPTPSSRSFDAIWKMPRVLASLPLHLAAMHICYDSIYWSPKQAIIKLALGTFTRIRLRTHYGKSFLIWPHLFTTAALEWSHTSLCETI